MRRPVIAGNWKMYKNAGEAKAFLAAVSAKTSEFKGTELLGDWVARAVPAFRISGYTLSTGQDAVRLTATDSGGKLAIDQIFVPRAHQ